MGVPGSVNNLLAAGGAPQYLVERSIRLNAADSAFLSRTPASAGNRKTWTWSCWIKRSRVNVDSEFCIFGTPTSANFQVYFGNTGSGRGDKLHIGSDAGGFYRISDAVFRDPSAWFNLVISLDTTQATATNRLRAWVNGVEITWSTNNAITQNADLNWNNTAAHQIGARNPDLYFDGYLADIHFIDGQALTPSSFTETSATTGQLIPKAYTGTFTGNSFWLKFADNSAATATTLGKDSSGLGNNWSPSNLSVTAGAGNDSLVDTPTSYGTDTGAGGEVRGNYATLNPLFSGTTLTNGNLDAEGPSNAWHIGRGTIAFPTSDKWYWEATVTGTASASYAISVATAAAANSVADVTTATGLYGIVNNTGTTTTKFVNGTASTISTAAAWAQNDILMCAYDGATGKVWFGRNGTWYPPTSGGSAGNPSAGTNETMTASGTVFPAVHCYGTSGDMTVNFGQRPFAYTAPSGFKALCDTNIPEGSITTSGSFTGNANADGPLIWLNGVPTAMTINSNAVTFGTHADKLVNGFKLRTSSTSYNTSGSNTYTITTTGAKFKYARAQANP